MAQKVALLDGEFAPASAVFNIQEHMFSVCIIDTGLEDMD